MKTFMRIFVLLILFLPVAASAEIKSIITEGAYNMGDGETPTVAESRALLNAKRYAIEQAGTYVESYSKVKNLQLTADEIRVMSSGVMEVSILDKKRTIVGEGFRFWVKIKALVNLDQIEQMASKVRDKSVMEDYKRIQDAYDKSQKEIEVLKKQLIQAQGDQKKEVETKIASNEKTLQVNEWYEKGANYYYGSTWKENKEYDKALEAFTVAIAMDQNNGKAYALRGDCYRREGNYDKAMSDFRKAASLCSGECQKWDTYSLIYFCMEMGGEYYRKGDYRSAVEAFSIPATIYDNLTDTAYRSISNLYKWRGLSYYGLRQYRKAIEDYDKAFATAPYLSDEEKGRVYANRGLAYYRLGNTTNAIADAQKGCDLGNSTGCENLKVFSPSSRISSTKVTDTKRRDRFIAYSNGTVLDTVTNLMWAAKDSEAKMNWSSANNYCENYRGGGYTDWRMPTKEEVGGLYDKGSISRNYFNVTDLIEITKITEGAIWASDQIGESAACVYFNLQGRPFWWSKTGECGALPVRSGK